MVVVPVLLHFKGELGVVIYSQLAIEPDYTGTAGERRWLAFWGVPGNRRAPPARILKFSIPDLSLFWQGARDDADALLLAKYFAEVVAEEYPKPREELTRYFHMDYDKIIIHLQHVQHALAGTTQPERR